MPQGIDRRCVPAARSGIRQVLMMTGKKAVVLLSGGLDSATVVAMAKADGYACYSMSFDYGQRHRAELQAAERVPI